MTVPQQNHILVKVHTLDIDKEISWDIAYLHTVLPTCYAILLNVQANHKMLLIIGARGDIAILAVGCI